MSSDENAEENSDDKEKIAYGCCCCGCLLIIILPVIIFNIIHAITGGDKNEAEQRLANSFTDSRDDKKYRYTTIGTQTWMAENLNYSTKGGGCYDDEKSKCKKYGALYDWATAMDIDPKCNIQTIDSCGAIISSRHRGICPEGWHIPSDAEWTILTSYVGDNPGKKLKAKSGWEGNRFWKFPWLGIYNGTDDYNFSALPGGQGWALESQYKRTLNSDYSYSGYSYRNDGDGLLFFVFGSEFSSGSWWVTDNKTGGAANPFVASIKHRYAKALSIGHILIGKMVEIITEGDIFSSDDHILYVSSGERWNRLSVRCVKD
jgi:uncharacterized protein (TIGR02145 family)